MNEDDLYRSLGRLEAKMDNLLEEVRINREERKDHETRLQSLEKDAHTGKFVLAGAAGLLGAFVDNIGHILGFYK